jgi:NitT/TauT family transport system ATP-binding protein
MVQPPFVSLSGVSKAFAKGGQAVLSDINLRIGKGEFTSLIGPSGCGKSTLLNLIAGLLPVSAGEIVVDGMRPENAREELSFVFQDANLLPWRTVRENVILPLQLRGMARDRCGEAADRMIELVKLAAVARLYPWQLSGGMKMRVSIARALSIAPRLLLLDEPFGALDEMTRDSLNEDLLRLREHNRWTAFFVTHSVAEAVFLSSQIVVLATNPGRIAEVVRVPFPFPRQATLRRDPEFHRLITRVSDGLRATHRPD